MLATYGTTWQNSAALPTGITNLAGPTADNSTMVIDRFWRIGAENYTTKPDLSAVTFYYSDNELAAPNTIAEERLGAQRWNETTHSWGGFLPTGQAEPSLNRVPVTAIPAKDLFSWWTLVDRSSPLPLELIAFEARESGNKVTLNWITAQEVNCFNFEIQRSADARTFTTIGTYKAKGGLMNNYQYLDEVQLTGTSYYRLKQNDLDGNFTYTPIRLVLREGKIKATAYPNPSDNHQFHVLIGEAPLGFYTVLVTDLKGSTVYTSSKNIDQKFLQLALPETIRPGIYLVTLQQERLVMQFKVGIK